MTIPTSSSSSSNEPILASAPAFRPQPSSTFDLMKPANGFSSRTQEEDDDDLDDMDGWDTAQEGDESALPLPSAEARRQSRLLKGKGVEVVTDLQEDTATAMQEDDVAIAHPNDVDDSGLELQHHAYGRHPSTPTPPRSSSPASSSAAVTSAINTLDVPGPSRSTTTRASFSTESQTLLAPIPAVNVIPTSPPAHQRVMDPTSSRTHGGSLDIMHHSRILSSSPSQESLRRRETVGPVSPTSGRRNNRRRSLDPRAGSNRLSGFFSNLLNMRSSDPPPASTIPSSASISSLGHPPSASSSRPSAKTRHVSRASVVAEISSLETPATPPPALPPPMLKELGLKMTAVTSSIPASQSSGPPLSGVFLAPHYLLLCHNQGLDVVSLKSPPATQPHALIRRVAFKSVLVMEQRGVMVAIAGRREGIRVYALDEVKKAVEWRIQVEIEREREKDPTRAKDAEGHHHAFFGTKRSMERKDELIASAAPRALTPAALVPNAVASSSAPARAKASLMPVSPPPTYSSLPPVSEAGSLHPPISHRGSSGSDTTQTGPSIPSQLPSSASSASVGSLLVVESTPVSRTRGLSVSTVSPPRADHSITHVQPSVEEGVTEDEAKQIWMERHHDSDDDALDPVAAGPSASAALDERTSVVAAGEAPLPNGTPRPTSTTTGTPLSARRASRPANLDLSPGTLGQANMGIGLVAASPAPTLRSMRHALSFTGSPPATNGFAPRSPRASTSLSLNGMDDGGAASDVTPSHEVGEDYISFAQAMAESRLPVPAPVPAALVLPVVRAPQRASTIISAMSAAASAPHQPAPMPLTTSPTTVMSSVPKSISQSEKKNRRRFSLMGGGGGKTNGSPNASSSSVAAPPAPSLGMGLAGASASTPNLAEIPPISPAAAMPGPSHRRSRLFGGGGTLPTPAPPSAPATMTRSVSHSSMQHLRPVQPMQTVDRIFQPQSSPRDPPISPFKSSHRSTSPLPPPVQQGEPSSSSSRNSRRFLPKLLTGFTKSDPRKSKEVVRKKTEVEKRLAAGGAVSAAKAPHGANGAADVGTVAATLIAPVHAPAPKLEYVKLPGTKGAIAIKAVETPKKSFLAILCGDTGEKIELFAGTYRTALGLSRTFILPDSPRSLELQLQGDDLVELFLVFSQNVFGLEPATVRVREVRIGRAERRAARRRAREARGLLAPDGNEGGGGDDALQTETVITTVVSVGDNLAGPEARPRTSRSSVVVTDATGGGTATPPGEAGDGTMTPLVPGVPPTNATSPEELAAIAAAAQFGPYTTFQQLSYAPKFPLGTIADDFIIPPTYTDYLSYRQAYEPTAPTIDDLLVAANTPAALGPPAPELPPRPPTPPPARWLYIDPKGVTQGPWKASLMQSWFADGFLPPDLPVRRDTETELVPLKDLCAAADDPDYPFRPPSPVEPRLPPIASDVPSVLLTPISLLEQPRRFGPPGMFYTSRGGHSTTIVDNRGKSVLRGRLNWTADDEVTKLGDVRRLEAFDTRGRAVIVALRQGGIEAVDVGDALCYPGDESRSDLPYFHPDPSGVTRRPTFTWKLGNPVGVDASSSASTNSIPLKVHLSKRSTLSAKKLSTAPGASQLRPTIKNDSALNDEGEGPFEEEIFYLGRDRDTVYFCERSLTSFRILSLGVLGSAS